MSDVVDNSQQISLWECLHDGGIEQLRSDLMSRTVMIVVDSLFHWEFHKLPLDTRFRIIGRNVRITEALNFEPWPGAWVPLQGTPWKQAEEQRRADYEKGRLVSTDWDYFTGHIEPGVENEILHAE